MKTDEIEALADSEGLAQAGFNLTKTLRRIVIPEFFLDVDNVIGQVHWRRAVWTQQLSVGTRNYDLPGDWEKFQVLRLQTSAGLENSEMTYIGEHVEKILTAEVATTARKPDTYYIVAGTSTPLFALRLGDPTDDSYTILSVYSRLIPFSDDSSPVDLDLYIPWQYQGGLVRMLKKEIYKDRFGVNDKRYTVEKAEYQEWLGKMAIKKEAGPRTKAIYVS